MKKTKAALSILGINSSEFLRHFGGGSARGFFRRLGFGQRKNPHHLPPGS